MHDFLWKLDAVTLSGDRRARLCDVSLEIQPGVTAVVGQSGAGKTSLLNLLVDFERPEKGTIVRGKTQADRLPLFWVPATGGLWPHLCVQDHLTFVAPSDVRSEHVETILQQFDLADKTAAYPDALSEGERTRLSVARAVAAEPAVLVMDEPLANVDATRVHRYWQAIRAHCMTNDTSLVFASHGVDTVLREATRVVCLSEGHMLYAGDTGTLYRNPASRELAEFLGPTNWFGPVDEARSWLIGAQAASCCRPEHLQVESANESPLRVVTAHYGSALGELEVQNEVSAVRRVFFHRPNGQLFQAGDRIVMKAILPNAEESQNDE